MKKLATLLVVVAVLASFVAACAAPAPEVVEKEITVEVTREVPVTVKETVISEVPVTVEVTKEVLVTVKETVISEVPVTVEVTREVPVTVKETVISEVPVTVEVTREVPVTVEVTRVVEVTPEPVASGPEGTVYGAEGTVFGTEGSVYRTEVMTLHSAVVDQDYRIYVALPPSYAVDSSKTYPALYLLDGNWDFIMATEFTRAFNFAELVPELIIVGIGYPTNDDDEALDLRFRDMTPTEGVSPSGGATGGAGDFLGFIQEELIPYIDASYRTDPEDRTIAGGSLGGLFSLYALFHAPETFHRYIATSPSLWWDHSVTFDYEEEFATNHSDLPVKLFLSAGGLELSTTMRLERFHESLEDRNYAGLDMEMVILEDEMHVTMIPAGLWRGLRAVFQ